MVIDSQCEQVQLPEAQGHPSEGCPLQTTRTNRDQSNNSNSQHSQARSKKDWELPVLEGLQLLYSCWPQGRFLQVKMVTFGGQSLNQVHESSA